MPTPQLIADVADIMLKSDLNDPGFLVIPNITEYLDMTQENSFDIIHQFQRKIFDGVCQVLFTQSTSPFENKSDFQIVNFKRVDGQAEQPDGFVGPQWTEKRVHHDPHNLFFTHAYGPLSGFSGGQLQLFDYKQMMQDKGLKFEDMFEADQMPDFQCRPVLRKEWQSAISPYLTTLTTQDEFDSKGHRKVPIVFLNNHRLAHAVVPLSISPDQSIPFHRIFNRVALEFKNAGNSLFPFHKPEYHANIPKFDPTSFNNANADSID